MKRINVTNAMKLIKKFKVLLIGESVKAFKESNSGLPLSAFCNNKKIYNEDNALGNRREGSGRNLKLNENLTGFILGVFFKDRKETLTSLVKILNDNFGVKVSEKTINRVLHAHDIEWTKPILRSKFDERIKKSRIEFLQILPLYC